MRPDVMTHKDSWRGVEMSVDNLDFLWFSKAELVILHDAFTRLSCELVHGLFLEQILCKKFPQWKWIVFPAHKHFKVEKAPACASVFFRAVDASVWKDNFGYSGVIGVSKHIPIREPPKRLERDLYTDVNIICKSFQRNDVLRV
jgi:hypothetical protein